MHVCIPSENLLVKSIWFDKGLVAISSMMNNFTKQVYHLWGRSQDCPISTKINRKIQERKQGISSKWKSSRDIIFLTLILVPYGKSSLSLFSKIHRYGSSSHFTLTSNTTQWPPSTLQNRMNIIGELILEHETYT